MNIMRYVLVAVIFFTGCSTNSNVSQKQGILASTRDVNTHVEKATVPATLEECTNRDGDWMQVSQGSVVNFGAFRCLNYKAADADKSCQGDSECEGGCGPVYGKSKRELNGGVCYSRVSDHCFHPHYNNGAVSNCIY